MRLMTQGTITFTSDSVSTSTEEAVCYTSPARKEPVVSGTSSYEDLVLKPMAGNGSDTIDSDETGSFLMLLTLTAMLGFLAPLAYVFYKCEHNEDTYEGSNEDAMSSATQGNMCVYYAMYNIMLTVEMIGVNAILDASKNKIFS